MSANAFFVHTKFTHNFSGLSKRLYFSLCCRLKCLVFCFIGETRVQKCMLLRRQNTQISIIVVPVIAINVVNLRAFKQFAHKCLRNKSVNKEGFTSYIAWRSVSQTYFYVR